MSRSHSLQRGFTLVELMVALAISVILLTGLVQILLANRQAYRVMEGANFMQENMRFAVERIAHSGRMAAHWGSSPLTGVIGRQPVGNTACSAAWAFELTSPIQAWDGGGTQPSGLGSCFDAANYEPGTDIVAFRYIESDPLEAGATLEPNQRYMLVETQTRRAQVFLGSSGLPLLPATNLGGIPDDSGIVIDPQRRVYRYEVEMFWVRRCNDPGVDGVCGNSDDGDAGEPIPTLMRGFFAADGEWTSEPMVDGAEQFQVEFQNQRNPWINATAASATAVGWRAFGGMRIVGIARSAQRENNFPEDTRTFDLSGDTATYTPPTAARKYLRTRYESTVSLRNHFRPLGGDV